MRRTAPVIAVLLLALALYAPGELNVSQPSPVIATQSGTWTVQPGNTPNTTPWLVSNIPDSASGDSLSASVKNGITSSVNVKASAGNVYGVSAANGAAAVCWVQLINSASAGTLGTAVIFSVPLPTSGVVNLPPGIFALGNFSSGIAVGIASTTNSSSACGTAGNVTVFYK